MAENRKRIMDKFQKFLNEEYVTYCDRHELRPTPQAMITFLIDRDMIPPIVIKRYTVLDEFENLYEKQAGKKTKTVHSLADFFNIPERTVWGILSQPSQKLKRK